MIKGFALSISWLVAFCGVLRAQTPPVAPPPAPPITATAPQVIGATRSLVAAPASQLYSIGSPTNEEQLYLELINRARANPAAEAARLAGTGDPDVLASYRYFGVSLGMMQTQFALIAPLPPLSMNVTLLSAARGHSADMLQNNYQAHEGPDGTVAQRIAAYVSGANGYTYGENIYSYAKSVFYGHAGFEVDWGGTALTGGMQSPAGHRLNIHGTFREVGIGVALGSNGSVGPQLVTQDFALRYDTPAFVTGVVYRDSNNNGAYDLGEGVGGVSVTINGDGYYAVTAPSGGYSVPVPGNGTYTVSFSGGGVASNQQTVTVSGGNNVKLDYVANTAGSTPTPTPAASATPPPGPAVLGNISTRAMVGNGSNVMIGGFIVTGTQPKKVMVRGIGPSVNLSGKLLDPTLELHDATGATIAANDNWGDNANAQEIVATTIAPSDTHEAAILISLSPGPYTATVSGVGHTTGTAIVEVYDLDRMADSQLANISTRALVQAGDEALIGGVIVLGQSPRNVLIRAIGPSLDITGALADPLLELHDANGALLALNDDWRTSQQSEIMATTVPPTNDKEAAIVTTLSPASYTAIVRGVNDTTGVAIVEVYALN
ncbi:MAG: CAP domain-containing protein [Chthoniobacterales bacterium]